NSVDVVSGVVTQKRALARFPCPQVGGLMLMPVRSRGVLSLLAGTFLLLSTLSTSAAELPAETLRLGSISGFGELEVRGVPVHDASLADGDHIRTGAFSSANVFLVK